MGSRQKSAKRDKLRRKRRKEPTAQITTFISPKRAIPKFLKVLEGWQMVHMVAVIDDVQHAFSYAISPERKVYRYAERWENPTLVIDSDILPPEHHIRLVRVLDKKTRVQVKRALRRKLKLMNGR